MNVDPKVAEAYLNETLDKIKNGAKGVSVEERLLAVKYQDATKKVEKLQTEAKQLVDQIKQAEQRVKEFQAQIQTELGKATGFLESLISLKFDIVNEEAAPEGPEVASVTDLPTAAVEEKARDA